MPLKIGHFHSDELTFEFDKPHTLKITLSCDSSPLTGHFCHVITNWLLQKFWFWFLASFSALMCQKVMGGSVFNAALLGQIVMLFKLCAVWQKERAPRIFCSGSVNS